jgi:hypothetical protein
MELLNSIDLIKSFKNGDLIKVIRALEETLPEKGKTEIENPKPELFFAAKEIKKASSQINEVIHAIGILNALPKILQDEECIKNVSLAAGTQGGRFDLETDIRVAEFKFSEWNSKGNDSRKRHVVADYVNLLVYETSKQKELYVLSHDRVQDYLCNSQAKWDKVLSKSGGVKGLLTEYLNNIPNETKGMETISDIVRLEEISIIDLEPFMSLA